jgi:hypothetical protein
MNKVGMPICAYVATAAVLSLAACNSSGGQAGRTSPGGSGAPLASPEAERLFTARSFSIQGLERKYTFYASTGTSGGDAGATSAGIDFDPTGRTIIAPGFTERLGCYAEGGFSTMNIIYELGRRSQGNFTCNGNPADAGSETFKVRYSGTASLDGDVLSLTGTMTADIKGELVIPVSIPYEKRVDYKQTIRIRYDGDRCDVVEWSTSETVAGHQGASSGPLRVETRDTAQTYATANVSCRANTRLGS